MHLHPFLIDQAIACSFVSRLTEAYDTGNAPPTQIIVRAFPNLCLVALNFMISIPVSLQSMKVSSRAYASRHVTNLSFHRLMLL